MNDFSIAHVIRVISDNLIVNRMVNVNGVDSPLWENRHIQGVPAIRFAISLAARNHKENIEAERDLHVIVTQRHNVYVALLNGNNPRHLPEIDRWVNVGNHDSCWPDAVASAVTRALSEIHTQCYKDASGLHQVPLGRMDVQSHFNAWYFGANPFEFVRVFSEIRTDDKGSSISHERRITRITPMRFKLHLEDIPNNGA